jgi:hypothetical protein
MCPHDIYYILSIPLVGGARATLQMAHMSSPLSKQCARAARCTVLIPYTRSFPLRAEATQILGVRAYRDYMGMASSSSILPFVTGPTCRGSEPLYMCPLTYKRGGMQRYNSSSREGHLDARHSGLHTTQALEQYNTQWSRVLRSGILNHSKPLHVLVFIPPISNKKNA